MEIDESDFRSLLSNYWYLFRLASEGMKLDAIFIKDYEAYFKKMQEKYKIY